MAQRTRAALLDVARDLFSTRGYFATGIADIVSAAQVTRGALYHHFRDKDDLFREVFVGICRELGEDAERHRAQNPPVDAWAALRATIDRYIDRVTRDAALRRIVVIDGPAVLGWTGWRNLSSPYSSRLIQSDAERAIRDGVIRGVPAGPLGHLLLAAINEGCLMIAESDDIEDAIAAVSTTLGELLDGLRVTRQPAWTNPRRSEGP